MTPAAAKVRLPPNNKPAHEPVIFFGTIEVAWIAIRDAISWRDGWASGLQKKAKANKRLALAVQQVTAFLHEEQPRVAPTNWWCKPPPTVAERAAAYAAGRTLTMYGIPDPSLQGSPTKPRPKKKAKRRVVTTRERVVDRLYRDAGVVLVAPPGGESAALQRSSGAIAFEDCQPEVHQVVVVEQVEQWVDAEEGDEQVTARSRGTCSCFYLVRAGNRPRQCCLKLLM